MAPRDGRPHRHARNGHGENANRPTEAHKRVSSSKPDDGATTAFIKQTLCQKSLDSTNVLAKDNSVVDDRPLEELLPPLTTSNEVDFQLYATLAVILHQFVQSWYSRITPDAEFVHEIVRVLAHCTRALETRLRRVDLELLLIDELPRLLDAHIQAVRIARQADRTDDHTNTAAIYQSLRPHPALAPIPVDAVTTDEQRENEGAWCQLLVNRTLPMLLPPGDLQNPGLRILISEILAELILHSAVLGKLSGPVTLWQIITKVVSAKRPMEQDLGTVSSTSPMSDESRSMSSAQGNNSTSPTLHARLTNAIARRFWSTLQILFVVWTFLRILFGAGLEIAALARSMKQPQESDINPPKSINGRTETGLDPGRSNRAILNMGVWSCLDRVILFSERMPWLCSVVDLLRWTAIYGPGQLGSSNGALDRYLSLQLRTALTHPPPIGPWPSLLAHIRAAAFPNNVLPMTGSTPPTGTTTMMTGETTAEMEKSAKSTCAQAILAAIPTALRPVCFAAEDEAVMVEDVERTLLDLLADPLVNKHLLVALVELLFVRLFPELTREEDDMVD